MKDFFFAKNCFFKTTNNSVTARIWRQISDFLRSHLNQRDACHYKSHLSILNFPTFLFSIFLFFLYVSLPANRPLFLQFDAPRFSGKFAVAPGQNCRAMFTCSLTRFKAFICILIYVHGTQRCILKGANLKKKVKNFNLIIKIYLIIIDDNLNDFWKTLCNE